MCVRERERDRQTDRQTEKERKAVTGLRTVNTFKNMIMMMMIMALMIYIIYYEKFQLMLFLFFLFEYKHNVRLFAKNMYKIIPFSDLTVMSQIFISDDGKNKE